MPTFNTKRPKYKQAKDLTAEYKTLKKGLNLLLRPTELGPDEMSQADNSMLIGSGVPTVRWGSTKYFTVNNTGTIRGFGTFKNSSTNEIFALSDEGYIAKKNNTTSTQIVGVSYPSGTRIQTTQLGGKTYIVSPDEPFVEYDGSNLTAFATISAPTGVAATNFSGASGPNRVSYKVSAIGVNGGTTTPSTNYVLADLPNDLADTQVHIFWSAPSASTLSGFEIYRGREGDESFLAGVGPDELKYVDAGFPASQTFIAPLTNTTGGVKSRIIAKYKDRILVVPEDDRSKLMISGRYPNHTKFNWLDGGGFTYIDPDSGDDITSIAIQPVADRIVVYKNHSSHLVNLDLVQIGNFFVLDPQYQPVSTQIGCSNQDSVATVENDTFYFGRDGLYVTGYEPNFLNIIRTNEISAKIRPYLDNLNQTDYDTASAMYVDNKYLLSFPARKEIVVYDRERGAFVGIWKLPFGVAHMRRYFDSGGTERWVFGSYNSNQVYTFESSLQNDDGNEISTTVRFNKEDFGDWSLTNIITFFHFLFRNIKGSVTVNLIAEDIEGSTSNIKTFTLEGASSAGNTGWGIPQWGIRQWGLTNGTIAGVGGDEVTAWDYLYKEVRLTQIEIKTNAINSNFEFLSAKIEGFSQGRAGLSPSKRV